MDILSLLEQRDKPLTIIEIATALSRNRQTISKTLEILRLTGRIRIMQQGQKKKIILKDQVQKISSRMPALSVLVVLNSDFTIQWVNEEVTRITGIPAGVFCGKHFESLQNTPINIPLITENLSLFYPGQTRSFEDWQRYDDQQYCYRYTLSYFYIADKNPVFLIIGEEITENKRLLKIIQEMNETLTSVVHNIPGLVFRRDLKVNRIKVFDDSFSHLNSFFPDAITESGVLSLDPYIRPEDRERICDSIQLSFMNGRAYEIEYEVVSGDHYRTLLERGRPVRDHSGEFSHIDGIILDVSEKKQTERALIRSEEKYRTLIEMLNEGIWAIDKESVTSFVNQKMAEILGYTVEEMTGRSLFSFMDDEGRWICEQNIKRRQQGIKEQHEFKFLKKNGTMIHASLETAPITGTDGEYLGAIAGVIDITDRKKTEEALREINELFSLFMHHSPIYAYIKEVTPEESRVLQASDYFKQIVGLPGRDIIGKTMAELFPAKFAAKITADDWSVVVKGEVLKLREDLLGRNYYTIKFPVVMRGKTYLAGYSIDITDQKKNEQALQELTKELTERNKEINCLYEISNIVERYENNCEKILQSIVNSIPTAMQYPEHTSVRLMVDGILYYAGTWQESTWNRSFPVFIHQKECGYLEICIYQECQLGDKTCFLGWEEKLLNTIAKRVGRIIERIQTQTELGNQQASLTFLGSVLECSSQPFAVGYPDGLIGQCNSAFEQLVGYTKEELATISWAHDLTPPEWQDIELITLKKMDETRTPTHYEKEYIRKDGLRILVDLFLHAMYDQDGNVEYYYAFVTDKTQQKQNIKRLNTSDSSGRTRKKQDC